MSSPAFRRKTDDQKMVAHLVNAAVEWLTRPMQPQHFGIRDDLVGKIRARIEIVLFGAACIVFACFAYGFLYDAHTGFGLALLSTFVVASRLLAIKYSFEGDSLRPVLGTGLTWAITVGFVVSMCAHSGQEVLVLLGGLTATGLAFGCAFANAGAPRFAALQALFITAPFVLGIVTSGVPHVWFIIPNAPVWAGGIFILISQAHEASAKLVMAEKESHFLAYHDVLTGLSNRASIMQALKAARFNTDDQDRIAVYLLYLDLDGFKNVNDNFGHQAGDDLLRAVAERFSVAVRRSDQIGRIGGDEFLVILRNILPDHVEIVAQRLVDAASAPFVLPSSVEVTIGASVGGARLLSSDDIPRALEAADSELYAAKSSGRGRISFAEEVAI